MVRLLSITLPIALLMGLLPISNHMSSMQTMRMDATAAQINNLQENAGDHSTSSCCDAIGTFVLTCDFMAFQTACIPDHGDSERVAYLAPIVQSIYVKTLAPPPKI
jgi:hypothetical protein